MQGKIIRDSWIGNYLFITIDVRIVFQWINYSWTVLDFACKDASVYNIDDSEAFV